MSSLEESAELKNFRRKKSLVTWISREGKNNLVLLDGPTIREIESKSEMR